MRGGDCWNKFALSTFLSNERPESLPLKVSDNGSIQLHIHMKTLKSILGLVAGAAMVVGLTGCDSGDKGGGGGGGNKGGGSGSKTSSYQQLAPGGVLLAQSGTKPSKPSGGSGSKTNAPAGGSGSKTNKPSGGSGSKGA